MEFLILVVALAVIAVQTVLSAKLVKTMIYDGITFIDVWLLLINLVTMINLIVRTAQLYIVT